MRVTLLRGWVDACDVHFFPASALGEFSAAGHQQAFKYRHRATSLVSSSLSGGATHTTDLSSNQTYPCCWNMTALGAQGATLFEVLRLESSGWPFTLGRCLLPVDDQAIALSTALFAPRPLE
jgi:hypothetical protein